MRMNTTKIIAVIGCLIITNNITQAQGLLTPEWIKFESSMLNNKTEGWGLSIDSEGFIYWPFNSNNLNQGLDIYCHKLDANGTLIWTTPFYFGGAGNQQSYVCNAKDTSLYIGGRNCPGTINSCDMLLIKVDKNNGSVIWSRTLDFGQNGYEEIDGLEIMSDGIYCGGWAQAIESGNFQIDIGLWKVDYNGNTIWTNYFGQAGTAEHQDGHFVVDDNHIFAAGLWGGTGIFNAYNGHSFLGKFSKNDGSYIDSVLFGHQSNNFADAENALGMTSDGTHLYVTGYTTPSIANDWQIFTVKYDKNFNQQWYTHWGGSGTESARAIAVADGYIFVAGQTLSSEYSSDDKADAVLLVYDTSGNFINYKTWGNPGTDEVFRDIVISGNDIYLSGTIGTNINVGDTDSAFVMKVNKNDLTLGVNTQNMLNSYHIHPYPNPFIDYTTFLIPSFSESNFQFKIYDLLGKEYHPEIIINNNGFILKKGNLNNGTYIFELQLHNIISYGKFIVH